MKKTLPIIYPPIETYQGSSFVLGVLLAHSNTANEYFNRYINLECKDTEDSYSIRLEFTNVTWEDYRLAGIAEMNLFFLKNIHRDKFINFIRERIEQGNYILFFSIDEFYLSYTKYNNIMHYLHDTYIYGYEEDTFCIMAYKDGKLKEFTIPNEEIINGMYYHIDASDNLSFCSFRPNQSITKKIELPKIKQAFVDYICSCNSSGVNANVIYGMNTYNILINCINKVIANKFVSNSDVDLRPFRFFWEHKKVLVDHVVKLKEYLNINKNIITMIENIENDADIVFKLMIKYSLTKNLLILNKVLVYLFQIREKEVEFVNQLLDEFSRNGI